MAFLKFAPLFALVFTPGGCTIDAFACSDATQCDWRDGPAVCLTDGVCAYPDDACPSGLRRSPNAAAAPGICVDETAPATTSETSSSSGPATTSTTSGASTAGFSSTQACVDWFPDADADGFGDASSAPVNACAPPKGSVENADDCNDNDPRVRPDHLQCGDNPGLVAWYRLDEPSDAEFTLDEAAGSVGTLLGGPSFGVEGPFGTAVRYAGHPDAIDIAEAVARFAPDGAPASEGTIEFWAQPDTLDDACTEDCTRFVFHVSDAQGDGFGNNTPDLHIHLDHAAQGSAYQWRAHIDGVFAGGENCSLAGPDVEFDRWTHVALRWTATGCTLLIDGVSADSSQGFTPSPQWTHGRIGHPPSRPDRAYEGAVDELMLFDHERSNAEIRRDCGRSPCPPA
ncbi:MAG: LamG domain-containing protein [Nannocystaceae bacterium]|nr:LamG domain-containing protein [Nannocystaceae bacterium]